MTLADDLGAPPIARRVAAIIKDHAARLELGSDWADAAAVRVLAEVTRRPGVRVVNDLSPLDTDADAPCDGICVMGNEVLSGGFFDVAAYPHPECPRHGTQVTGR